MFAVVGLCFICSEISQAAEEHFNETKCGPAPWGPEIYEIRLEAPDGTRKRLTFNNKTENGLFVFTSTSLKYLKWASDLSDFEALKYRATDQGVGVLSAGYKHLEQVFELGTISKECWDELRRYVKGLVRTAEITQD